MAKIKVKYGGCGIRYKDGNGVERHALKTPENGPFECDDAQAARLVGLGMAEYVGCVKSEAADPAPQPEAQQVEPVQEPEEHSREPENGADFYTAEALEKWDYNDLKALAADLGAVPTGSKKKGDYIAAIVAAQAEPDDVDDPDNDLPDLTAADPE